MRPFLTPVLVVLFAAVAVADDKDAAADLKAMVGKWDIQKAELGGKDVAGSYKKAVKFEVAAGGKFTTQVGEGKYDGTFTVDPAKKPKRMDIKPSTGPNKGKTLTAVYTLDGDDLTICYDLTGADYPTGFESKPDTKLFLVTYKRKK